MSTKRYAMYMGAILMAMSQNQSGVGGPYIKPEKLDVKRHGGTKQGQKKWRVNNVIVEAATKKAAIKKAEKHLDYISRSPMDIELQ